MFPNPESSTDFKWTRLGPRLHSQCALQYWRYILHQRKIFSYELKHSALTFFLLPFVCFLRGLWLVNKRNFMPACQLRDHSWFCATCFNTHVLASCGYKESVTVVNIYCLSLEAKEWRLQAAWLYSSLLSRNVFCKFHFRQGAVRLFPIGKQNRTKPVLNFLSI